MDAALPPDGLRAGYDRSAPLYDERFAALQLPKHAAALARVPVAPGERVLDVGCGTGLLAARLGHARVIGLDLSAGMLARARGSLVPVQGDARLLPFRDACFDVAFAVTALLVPARDLPRALLELRRVLVPGGRAAITLLASDARTDFARTLAACGFRVAGEGFECGQDRGWVCVRL